MFLELEKKQEKETEVPIGTVSKSSTLRKSVTCHVLAIPILHTQKNTHTHRGIVHVNLN